MEPQDSSSNDVASTARGRTRTKKQELTSASPFSTTTAVWVFTGLGFALILAVLLTPFYQKQQERAMWSLAKHLLTAVLAGVGLAGPSPAIDLDWYPPAQTKINNLSAVVNEKGVYGFIYNSSETPDSQYGTYNWCNMPHVRRDIYVKAPEEYELVYVELIHRHHKRTPYASNSFPVEPYPWHCDDHALFHYTQPLPARDDKTATPSYWQNYLPPTNINPFPLTGWTGRCQFPQITAQGLDDSWQHGADLHGVYHDLLGFLPPRDSASSNWRHKVLYRVTNNQITSQVAGSVIHGMWRTSSATPLLVQPATIDSLEPKYDCPAARSLFASIQSRDKNTRWAGHLKAAGPLYERLDGISGVPGDETELGFHVSLDHYYDYLSARQCHAKGLPCRVGQGGECITQEMADETYRFGQWEYSHVYRDAGPETLAASVASIGVWIAELAGNLRGVVAGGEGEGRKVIWRHNIAHDGSVSRVLGVLQVDEMVWPGMGSEVVFELFRRRGEGDSDAGGDGSGYFVRVLFSGRVLKSSNPSLGVMDILPVEKLLAYFDGLVGKDASLVVNKCRG